MSNSACRCVATALMAVAALSAWAAPSLSFSAQAHAPVVITPETSTGLNAVYVLYDASGVTASYTASSSGSAVKWYKYSNLGGGYAEEIVTQSSGRTSSVKLTADDLGYIVEDGTNRAYFWITNYMNHSLRLDALEPAAEQDCDRVLLDFRGKADEMVYYSINGRRCTLDREMTLEYLSLEYDEDTQMYNQVNKTENYAFVGNTLSAPMPLCDTEFHLSGDKFLRSWGMEENVTSPYFTTIGVAAETTATQAERDNDNEKKADASGLGGSAPADIEFKAVVTDAAIFTEWQVARDMEFDLIDLRFNTTEFNYTFRDEGRTYVRFVANNAAGTCEFVGPTYEVTIGQSALEIPNAFSPGASEGVNDIWKVSYRSLVSFECHIFNKWGQKMCSFTDPSQGWDGRYKGKLVPAGVYYYVIKAKGADGIKYERSGDINIIGFRAGMSSGEGSDTPSTDGGGE